METIFRKVAVSERLPILINSDEKLFITDIGQNWFHKNTNGWNYGSKPCNPAWWLEEIELPTQKEIEKASHLCYMRNGLGNFDEGANWMKDFVLAVRQISEGKAENK